MEVWLKIYIRALTQASDYDENAKNKTIDPLYLKLVPQMEDPRPLKERVAVAAEEELAEVNMDIHPRRPFFLIIPLSYSFLSVDYR